MTDASVFGTDRPKVWKAAGVWLWTCDHGAGRIGDEFPPGSVRDPWTAALTGALRHATVFHDDTDGETVGYVEVRDA